MRLRLLIDIEIDDAKIPALAEMMKEQPTTDLKITSGRGLGEVTFKGRFMGGVPVHAAPEIVGYDEKHRQPPTDKLSGEPKN